MQAFEFVISVSYSNVQIFALLSFSFNNINCISDQIVTIMNFELEFSMLFAICDKNFDQSINKMVVFINVEHFGQL